MASDPVAIPAQAPQREGVAKLPDVSLYYWDTGGSGEPVMLLHPYTGSALVWSYQQPVLAKAGYRVIAYSRRGFAKSETGLKDKPGTGPDDLNALADFLGLKTFHTVASAGGAFTALDYAISYPGRIKSQVLACSLLNVDEKEIKDLIARITPQGFNDLPAEFREVSPSYRAANPDGTKAWAALEHVSGDAKVRQPNKNVVTYATLAQMKTPTLLVAGDSDLIAPPPLQRLFRAHIPGAQLSVLTECGHSAYWEQPVQFNRDVLAFLGKHRI